MAAKKRRKKRRARARKSNPTKTVRRKKRRSVGAAKRRRRANPRRRARARHLGGARRRRRAVANPRRRSLRRRRRRNPGKGLPGYAKAALAALAGLGTYAVGSALTFNLTQRLDPSLNTLERNRYIVAGAAVLGGVALAAKHPLYGAAVAAAGAVMGLGSKAAIKLGELLPAPPRASVPVGAVYGNLGGYVPQMGAVYGNLGGYVPQMGAVYDADGAFMPPAPPY